MTPNSWLFGLMAVVLVIAACSGSESATDEDQQDDGAAVLAAAVTQLISTDHGFGDGPPPFTEYLVQSGTDPGAGSPPPEGATSRPLTEAERAAIATAVADYGPLQWIADPADWQTVDLRPTIDGAAIIGVGEPTFAEGTALVPVSMWCGSVCGIWVTYRIELREGVWTVIGTEGPIAIS